MCLTSSLGLLAIFTYSFPCKRFFCHLDNSVNNPYHFLIMFHLQYATWQQVSRSLNMPYTILAIIEYGMQKF